MSITKVSIKQALDRAVKKKLKQIAIRVSKSWKYQRLCLLIISNIEMSTGMWMSSLLFWDLAKKKECN